MADDDRLIRSVVVEQGDDVVTEVIGAIRGYSLGLRGVGISALVRGDHSPSGVGESRNLMSP